MKVASDMPRSRAHWMNLVALALLITALIAFVAFHFLIVEIYRSPDLLSKTHEMGWELWPSLVEFLKAADFDDIQGMIAASAFLTYCLLVVASPIAITVLRTSRLLWWTAVIASGAAMCGLGGVIVLSLGDQSFSTPGPGLFCILASLILNFLGLLFIRREVPFALVVDIS